VTDRPGRSLVSAELGVVGQIIQSRVAESTDCAEVLHPLLHLARPQVDGRDRD
jgi:hypothetical protein